MYYFFCEKIYMNSIKFDRTLSPGEGVTNVTGRCSANAVMNQNETFRGSCSSRGEWTIDEGQECLCQAGYEDSEIIGCSACSSNSFKPDISNSKCAKCHRNSVGNQNRTACDCLDEYFAVNSGCYPLPSLEQLPVARATKDSINVTWNEPSTRDNLNEDIFYDVECFACRTAECKEPCEKERYLPRQKNLSTTFVVVDNLKAGAKYKFRVYPKNSLNYRVSMQKWKFLDSEPVSLKPEPKKPAKPSTEGDPIVNIIVAIISVLMVILIILLLTFLFRRRRKSKKRPIRVELPSVGRKHYVDPSNYERVEQAVLEFANELDHRAIFLERLVGGGEFGDVYKGTLTIKSRKKIPIAVKTLKHDASQKSERDFLLEASVMAQFDNPNIVRMEGVVTKTTPRMIVLEYMSNGSLDNYLKSNDGMLTRLQLIGMARGVAAGMVYLSEINFVHRDLAARNVLVNDSMLCKISDFGLSRELETTESSTGEYETSGGRIPVRWTAPEAIKYRKFTTASDVWSFGILLWEIMSFAQRPYWEWDNYKVMHEVDEGFRLPPPQKCPVGVHGLMLHCWKRERSERPSFEQLVIVIDRWIRSPETLDDEINFFITIGEWLSSIKMGSYKNMFIDAGYRKQSEILNLTDEDLKAIGITLIGHRNKIRKGIETLKTRKARVQSFSI